ncbi:MAG: hypothetical protein M3Q52_11290 [Pseudomonadota bacterium]|nr:hypothetical protein [Pseudomonadota bacterium]
MSRFDGKLDPAGEAIVAASELLAALGPEEASEQQRHSVIALSLSGDEGWKQALLVMGGAFAPDVARANGRDKVGSCDR